jgi:clan AA aspartic protease (TIGR02281 family)
MWPLLVIDWDAVATALMAGAATCALLTCGGGHSAPQANGKQVVIRADASGACRTSLTVNGHAFPVEALLDSGAIGHALIFGSNHADALGFDTGSLSYSHTYGSANGEGHYASVTLREVRLSSFIMRNVPAEITEASQDEPLLGAEVLHRLNFTTSNGYCLLSMPSVETRVASVRDAGEPVPPSPDRWREKPARRVRVAEGSHGDATRTDYRRYCRMVLRNAETRLYNSGAVPGCEEELGR